VLGETLARSLCVCLLLVGVALAQGGSAGKTAPLPQGAGLAARYPGDVGLERDPSVIIVENFEEGTLEALAATRSPKTTTGARWTSIAGAKGEGKTLTIVTDPANVHAGEHALEILVDESTRESGNLFARLQPGYDRLYGRFYIKFAEDYPYESHTGLALNATTETVPWHMGKAGIVPKGDDRFGGMLEPEPGDRSSTPGFWCFYIYWHEMKGRWGNVFQGDPPTRVEKGRWIACELMFKANSTPQARDGECAYWIDGKLRYHGTGFNWRTTDDLKLNTVHLHHYMNKNGASWKADQSPRRQWFDDIVIATEYIGPMVGTPE